MYHSYDRFYLHGMHERLHERLFHPRDSLYSEFGLMCQYYFMHWRRLDFLVSNSNNMDLEILNSQSFRYIDHTMERCIRQYTYCCWIV